MQVIIKPTLITQIILSLRSENMKKQQQQIDLNFVCMICTELASNAVETTCCGQIMCEQCVNDIINKKHQNCPNCRSKLEVKASVLARRIISTIKVSCPENCGQKVNYKDLQAHLGLCPQKAIMCKICANKVQQKNIVEHMKAEHMQKLYEICVSFNTEEYQPKMSKIMSEGVKSSKLVESKIKNVKNRACHMGTTGKYYCGERALIGKCKCCDGRCGPTNGQNCDDCMKADVNRLNLPKGCLLNPEGYVCEVEPTSGVYFCGRLGKNEIFCSALKPCWACQRVAYSVKLGRYKNVI